MYEQLRTALQRYERTRADIVGSQPAGASGSGSGGDLPLSTAGSSARASSSSSNSSSRSSGGEGSRSSDLLTAAQLAAFCPETAMVGQALLLDFEKAGVNIRDARQQARMQALMNSGYHYAALFNRNLNDHKVSLCIHFPLS